MVGERGPELEATGPSRIFSHNQTASMFKDPDLKDAVRSLKEKLQVSVLSNDKSRWTSPSTPSVLMTLNVSGMSKVSSNKDIRYAAYQTCHGY